MKINGEFILREIIGEYVLVPVGETSLHFNGIISLNEVGAVIWKAMEAGKDRQTIVKEIFDTFDVDWEQAQADLDEFLDTLKKKELIL